MRRYLIRLNIIFVFLLSSNLFANTFDIFGISPRATALGGAYTALADDPAAVYYNPSALANVKYPEVQIGFIFATTSLGAGLPSDQELQNLTCIDTDGKNVSCLEVKEKHYGEGGTLDQISQLKPTSSIPKNDKDDIDKDGNTTETKESATIEWQNNSAKNVEDIRGYYIGVANNINDYLYFGLLFYSPTDKYAAQSLKLVWQPFYLDYCDRPQRAIVIPAIGLKVLPYLSLGFSINITMSTKAETTAFFPLDDPDKSIAVTNKVKVNNSPKFNYSILYSPLKNLSIGLSYVEETYMQFTTSNVVGASILSITNISIPTLVRAVGLYSPRHITLGVAYRPFKNLATSFDLQYSDWSEYIPPFPKALLLSPQGQTGVIGDVLADPINQPIPLLHFSDTLTPRLGIEYTPFSSLILRLGFYYEPTPTPKQTFSTNILDNNTYVISGGIGTNFKAFKNVPFLPEKVNIDVVGQLARMIPQTYVKDSSYFQTNYNSALNALKSKDQNVYNLYLQSLLTRGMIKDEVDNCIDPNSGEPIEGCIDKSLNTVNPGYPAYTFGGTIVSVGVTIGAYF